MLALTICTPLTTGPQPRNAAHESAASARRLKQSSAWTGPFPLPEVGSRGPGLGQLSRYLARLRGGWVFTCWESFFLAAGASPRRVAAWLTRRRRQSDAPQ